MTFDETSEFIRNIGNRQTSPEERRSRQISVKREPSESAAPSNGVDADSLLAASSSAPIKQEPGDDDDLMEGAEPQLTTARDARLELSNSVIEAPLLLIKCNGR